MSANTYQRTVPAQFGENKDLLKQAPQHAFDQLVDAKRGKSDTRENVLRANASLPPDSWQQVDNAVYDTTEETLALVDYLRGQGLVHSIDLMSEVDTWYLTDGSGEASLDMSPETAVSESSVSFGRDGCPVPIIHDDYSLGFREGSAEGRGPNVDLETMNAENAARNVSELIERLFVGDENLTISGVNDAFTLYGMTDHPATATGSTSADWTADNSVIREDIRAMRSVLKNERNFNPTGSGYTLAYGTQYHDVLDDADPEGDGNMTVRERVENLANIGNTMELDFLPEKSVLMFRPTSDVIEVGMASDMQTVQWEEPFRDSWKVLASMYPRIKQTDDKENGIVFWTA